MVWWVRALFVFNLVDIGATVFVLANAHGPEYNPIAAWLYRFHPVVWMMVKFALWSIGAAALLSDPEDKTHRVVFACVTAFYGVLSLYQIAVLTLGAIANAY